MNVSRLLLFSPVWVAAIVFGCPLLGAELCPTVQTSIPVWKGARFELRRCEGGILQLAAYGAQRRTPSVVRDTHGLGVVSLVVSGDVVVLETPGPSSNMLQVIMWEGGQPKLVFQETYKAYAEVKTSRQTVEVFIPQPGGTRRLVGRYPTGYY